MNSKTMFLSFIPWALFTVLAGHGNTDLVALAAAIATAAAIGVTAHNTRGSTLKLVDLTGIATFSAITVIAFLGDDAVRRHVADYGRGGSALVLAAVMLGSSLLVPFSEQYAREQLPRQYWSSPVFRAINRQVSAVWGSAILVMAGGHLLSGYLEAADDLTRRGNLLLNWALPVALVFGAMKITEQIVADRRAAVSSS